MVDEGESADIVDDPEVCSTVVLVEKEALILVDKEAVVLVEREALVAGP